jgi:lipopolysaccharide transport system permease protein
LFLSAFREVGLVVQLVRREVEGRYRGSILGVLWSFIAPLFMLGVYTFVFGCVFQSRWNAEALKGAPFALVLFSGLMVFGLFSETVSRAGSVIIGNPNYIKRVVFPLETLPLIPFGSALVNFVIALGIFLTAHIWTIGVPHFEILLLPVVLLPLVLFSLGISWLLASLGVFLRDINQILPIVISALLFLSPVFYPSTAVPEALQPFYEWNLIGRGIETARTLMFSGTLPDGVLYLADLGASVLICQAGFYFFQKTRKGFADVL